MGAASLAIHARAGTRHGDLCHRATPGGVGWLPACHAAAMPRPAPQMGKLSSESAVLKCWWCCSYSKVMEVYAGTKRSYYRQCTSNEEKKEPKLYHGHSAPYACTLVKDREQPNFGVIEKVINSEIIS